MARRPSRSHVDELTEHARLAKAASEICAALVKLEPGTSEFFVARKMLDDGVRELERKLSEQQAPKASAPAKPESEANS